MYGSCDLGMTRKTEGNHQLRVVVPGHAVVNCNRTLSALQRSATRYSALVTVTS